MVPGLKEIDAVCAYGVHHPMFLGNATRPRPCQNVLQRLGLPDTLERIPHHGLHQIENPQRHPSIRLDPVPQILTKLGMEDREPFSPPCQG